MPTTFQGVTSLLALLAAGLLACGSETPEERLAETRERVAEVRSEVKALEARAEKKREAVRNAEEALEKARSELRDAESELARTRKKLDERATDVALFRTLQQKLLEHDALEQFALGVEVADGVVTLRGEVDEPSQVEEALEVVREMAGVEKVENGIRVRNAPAPRPAD